MTSIWHRDLVEGRDRTSQYLSALFPIMEKCTLFPTLYYWSSLNKVKQLCWWLVRNFYFYLFIYFLLLKGVGQAREVAKISSLHLQPCLQLQHFNNHIWQLHLIGAAWMSLIAYFALLCPRCQCVLSLSFVRHSQLDMAGPFSNWSQCEDRYSYARVYVITIMILHLISCLII